MVYELFPALSPSPYLDAFWLCLALIGATWVLSIVTREYSWTDRVWSVAPAVYGVMVSAAADFADPRLNLMTLLVSVWAVRLTTNFVIKGGYAKGGEDYRWEILKAKMSPAQFQVTNLLFIAGYQNVLVYLFMAPMHVVWLFRDTPVGVLDYVAAALFAGLLLVETVADWQMLRFQNDKKDPSFLSVGQGPQWALKKVPQQELFELLL